MYIESEGGLRHLLPRIVDVRSTSIIDPSGQLRDFESFCKKLFLLIEPFLFFIASVKTINIEPSPL